MASKFWASNVAGDFSNGANWSNSNNGIGGAGAPADGDDVFFNANGSGDCRFDQSIVLGSLLANAFYTGILAFDAHVKDIVCTGNWTIHENVNARPFAGSLTFANANDAELSWPYMSVAALNLEGVGVLTMAQPPVEIAHLTIRSGSLSCTYGPGAVRTTHPNGFGTWNVNGGASIAGTALALPANPDPAEITAWVHDMLYALHVTGRFSVQVEFDVSVSFGSSTLSTRIYDGVVQENTVGQRNETIVSVVATTTPQRVTVRHRTADPATQHAHVQMYSVSGGNFVIENVRQVISFANTNIIIDPDVYVIGWDGATGISWTPGHAIAHPADTIVVSGLVAESYGVLVVNGTAPSLVELVDTTVSPTGGVSEATYTTFSNFANLSGIDIVAVSDCVDGGNVSGVDFSGSPILGFRVDLTAAGVPQTNLVNLTAVWWESNTPNSNPAGHVTTESTDGTGRLEVPLPSNTGMQIDDEGFVLVYLQHESDLQQDVGFMSRLPVIDLRN